MYKHYSDPSCPPIYSGSRFPLFLPFNGQKYCHFCHRNEWTRKSRKKKQGECSYQEILTVSSPPWEILIFKKCHSILGKMETPPGNASPDIQPQESCEYQANEEEQGSQKVQKEGSERSPVTSCWDASKEKGTMGSTNPSILSENQSSLTSTWKATAQSMEATGPQWARGKGNAPGEAPQAALATQQPAC